VARGWGVGGCSSTLSLLGPAVGQLLERVAYGRAKPQSQTAAPNRRAEQSQTSEPRRRERGESPMHARVYTSTRPTTEGTPVATGEPPASVYNCRVPFAAEKISMRQPFVAKPQARCGECLSAPFLLL
jgi:hypothetical protein